MRCSALPWSSSLLPAQASATTRTGTPASAAGSTVETTQQSVATPATVSGPAPTTSASSGPHLPNVVALSTRAAPGSSARS